MSRADEVDLDRLADYAAGALDPTGTAEVAGLVRDDDRWARALDALVAADAAVAADLRAADVRAARPEPMPADVVDRIEAALREAATVSPPRSAGVVSLAAARQARRRRFSTGITAAAASLVLVLCGFAFVKGVLPGSRSADSTAGGAVNQPEADHGAAPPPAGGPAMASDGPFAPLVTSSGLDYTDDDLRSLREKPASGVVPNYTSSEKDPPDAAFSEVPPVPQAIRNAVPVTLTRLTEPAALQACLSDILAGHPGIPILLDYARYAGRPALIVSIRAGTRTTVVAVGPDCGIAGSHQLAVTRTP